ncbi:MAG: hypothetical protein KF895_11575 [Parvibaculum sp.]|nr:hypothetical protein [Parvibaculum sp.]
MKRAAFLSVPLLIASLAIAHAETGTVAMDHGPDTFRKIVTELDYAARNGGEWRWLDRRRCRACLASLNRQDCG